MVVADVIRKTNWKIKKRKSQKQEEQTEKYKT